jgi:hypothetical protein
MWMTSPSLSRCISSSARGVFVIVVATGLVILSAGAQTAAAPHRVPVLVELFTSEGCSDCPPADALLERLDATQAVPGADAIVLSEHVTYWNHQGWRDPFSLAEMDERQNEYVQRFGLTSNYTPQMVVDGATQFVGSNAVALETALVHAAQTPKPELAIENARWDGGAVSFAVHVQAGSSANLIAALAANTTRSEVVHGENAGRTLHHVAVVRVMKNFGLKAGDGRLLRLSGGGLEAGDAAKDPVRLIVFVADRKSGRVVAAAEQTVSR